MICKTNRVRIYVPVGVETGLTKPGIDSQLIRVVAHGTDEPEARRLPHCIQQSIEYHEPDMSWVPRVVNIHLLRVYGNGSPGVRPEYKIIKI